MNIPTLRQLQYAVAVADHLNFGRAAKACLVTQPGLSAQIQELEQLLETPLFERDRRQVLVTEAGARVVARARAVLSDVELLTRNARGGDAPLSEVLRMGVIPTVAPYVLPEAVRRLRREYPQCRPLLHEAQTAALIESVRSGKLDLALLALDVDTGPLVTEPLYEDPFWLIVSEEHRLAKRKRVSDADLHDEAVLLLEDGHCLRDHALSVCKLSGARELGDFRATSLPTLVEMVASNLGVSLLPEMALKLEVRPPRGLRAIPFQRPGHHRTIGLVWRPQSPRAAEFQLIAQLMRVVAASHSPFLGSS